MAGRLGVAARGRALSLSDALGASNDSRVAGLTGEASLESPFGFALPASSFFSVTEPVVDGDVPVEPAEAKVPPTPSAAGLYSERWPGLPERMPLAVSVAVPVGIVARRLD